MTKRESKIEGVNALPELGAGFTEIKKFFKAGAVPREADYAKLIEYVHYLHKLLGVEGDGDGHVPQLGNGLVADEGVLNVNLTALAGAGLTRNGEQIDVVAGNGIQVGEQISLSAYSWFYSLAHQHLATHYARFDFLSKSLAVMFFKAISEDFVVVNGYTINGGLFSPDVIGNCRWGSTVPIRALSTASLSNFCMVFQCSMNTEEFHFDVCSPFIGNEERLFPMRYGVFEID